MAWGLPCYFGTPTSQAVRAVVGGLALAAALESVEQARGPRWL